MKRSRLESQAEVTQRMRCAVYTRKSTEEGLDKEFNTLDAQREAGENYIKSLVGEHWECMPTRYDDGGFTGGNMDRPALKRLMADIAAGLIDCVVVYKVDRLSRSLPDFARMMESFDQRKVAFVSVTQQFNTANSMGRLMLNVLLSFAQFEREIISERTRDKIAATRRKGKWSGGRAILGYDVVDRKLIVNATEAEQVRSIFRLYLEHESVIAVNAELNCKGWKNKRWTTKKGVHQEGSVFNNSSLYKMLTNVVYAGKVRYKNEVHPGEHPAIIDPELWKSVQAVLSRNGRSGNVHIRNQFGAILKGLIRCVPCGTAMTPTHTTRQAKRYRYYVCSSAQKKGWHTCPSKQIQAPQIEDLVVQQISSIGQDPRLLTTVLADMHQQKETRLKEQETEQKRLEKELKAWHADVNTIARQPSNEATLARLVDLQARITEASTQLRQVQERLTALRHDEIREAEVAKTLSEFGPLWKSMTPIEQMRLLNLLVEQVHFDGSTSKVSITFREAGLSNLGQQQKGKSV